MQYQIPAGNLFGVLTAVVAPAILTNASSVLALGTGNRLARVVDRTRVVYGDLAATEPGSPEHGEWLHQLDALRQRGQTLLAALRLFYAALGLFAATALVSVGGSISAYYNQHFLFLFTGGLAILTGVCAVAGLAIGCSLMVHETRLAVRSLAEEAKIRMQPAAHGKVS
jgi:Ni/Fe-hydrogenase subunit HybB-like protein